MSTSPGGQGASRELVSYRVDKLEALVEDNSASIQQLSLEVRENGASLKTLLHVGWSIMISLLVALIAAAVGGVKIDSSVARLDERIKSNENTTHSIETKFDKFLNKESPSSNQLEESVSKISSKVETLASVIAELNKEPRHSDTAPQFYNVVTLRVPVPKKLEMESDKGEDTLRFDVDLSKWHLPFGRVTKIAPNFVSFPFDKIEVGSVLLLATPAKPDTAIIRLVAMDAAHRQLLEKRLQEASAVVVDLAISMTEENDH